MTLQLPDSVCSSAVGHNTLFGRLAAAFAQALPAHATDLKMPGLDVTPARNFIGQTDPVHVMAGEITDEAALGANKMVMDVHVPVKAQAVTGHLNPRNQPLILQAVQNAVHRVERDVGNMLTHPPENDIRVWVFVRAGHFPENRRALRCDPEASTPAHLMEPL